jgi:hypothetical protein
LCAGEAHREKKNVAERKNDELWPCLNLCGCREGARDSELRGMESERLERAGRGRRETAKRLQNETKKESVRERKKERKKEREREREREGGDCVREGTARARKRRTTRR